MSFAFLPRLNVLNWFLSCNKANFSVPFQLQDPQKPDTAAMRKQIDEKQARIDEMEKRMLKLKEKNKELETKAQQVG